MPREGAVGSPWLVRKLKLNYSEEREGNLLDCWAEDTCGERGRGKGGWDQSLDSGELVRGGESNGNREGTKELGRI